MLYIFILFKNMFSFHLEKWSEPSIKIYMIKIFTTHNLYTFSICDSERCIGDVSYFIFFKSASLFRGVKLLQSSNI